MSTKRDIRQTGAANAAALVTLVAGAVLGLAVCMDSQPRKPHKPSTPKQQARPPAKPATRPSTQPVSAMGLGVLYGLPSSITAISRTLNPTVSSPLVVVHYGDSHSAAGALADELRTQAAGSGVISPGFVAPAHPRGWNARVKKSKEWDRQNWLRTHDRGSFGPLGLAFIARRAGARMDLTLKGTVPDEGIQVTAFYYDRSGHLPFSLTSEGKVLAQVGSARYTVENARAPEANADVLGRHTVTLPAGARSLSLEVTFSSRRDARTLRFFGFLVRYPNAVVEWDTMAVGGTVITGPLRRADKTMEEYLKLRQPSLMVLWYGTNSAASKVLSMERYGDNFGKLVERFRAALPGVPILIVGPPDFLRRPDHYCYLSTRQRWAKGRRRKRLRHHRILWRDRAKRACNPDGLLSKRWGKTIYPVAQVTTPEQWERYKTACQFYPVAHVPRIVDQQRWVALEHDCAFFNTYGFMGGPMSMLKWACASPRLGSLDMVHLTNQGYRHVARSIYKTLQTYARLKASSTSK